MARTRLNETPIQAEAGSYFTSDKEDIEFIHSGCTRLNCAFGCPGWPLGRIGNIIGNKSTGKTLLAMEAIANFHRQYPDGKIFYREAEAAFDPNYAKALGIPIDVVDFGNDKSDFFTIEGIFEDLEAQLDYCTKHDIPALYIVDSLDALSDRVELKMKIDEGTYGTSKAKMMSRLFRQMVKRIESSRMAVIFISQIRDIIGFTVGKKVQRSGGHALDFYASLVVWLTHTKRIKKTIEKVERVIGVSINAMVEKNKIGLPFRDCDFDIMFGYGIDDLMANLDWLVEIKREDVLAPLNYESAKDAARQITQADNDIYFAECEKVAQCVTKVSKAIEEKFLPNRRKYA